MIARFAAVIRAEVFTLLRTSEAYTFGLLPATLMVPFAVVFTVLMASFQRDPVLALPAGDRPELVTATFVSALERDWQVRWVDDPAAEVTADRVDAAVLSWRQDGPLSLAVDLTTSDPDARPRVSRDLERAVEREIDRRITAAGGEPATDRRVGSVSRSAKAAAVNDVSERFLLFVFAAFVAGYLGCFLVPARTTTERLSGALEAVSVTSMPLGLWYAARVVVSAAFTGLVVLIPVASLALLIGGAGGDLPEVGVLDLAELFAVLMAFDAAFVVCGLAANSVRMSLYFASYAVLATLPVAVLPFWHEVRWLPIAGMAASDAGVGEQVLRIGFALGAALVLLVVAGGVARLDRQLPTVGAGE